MPMQDLLLEIKELIIEALNLEDISPQDIGDDTPLFADDGIGLDSIDALELGVVLRKKYRLQLDKDDTRIRDHFRTARSLAEFVKAQRAISQ